MPSPRPVGSLYGMPNAAAAQGDVGDDLVEKALVDHSHQYATNKVKLEALDLSPTVNVTSDPLYIYNLANWILIEGSVSYNNDIIYNTNIFEIPDEFRSPSLVLPLYYMCNNNQGVSLVKITTGWFVQVENENNGFVGLVSRNVSFSPVRYVNHDII